VRQIQQALLQLNILIGPKRVRRLMRKMAIEAHYPKPSLSKLGRARYIHPYLLRHMNVTRPNQVWSTDITYISMPCGHAYLYAIIDVYSRLIVGWGLYTTLEAKNAVEVLEKAIEQYGKPQIINSDQGSQYTCPKWIETLKEFEIQISMDGRGRCLDNPWIERFWHTLKMEYVYLHPHSTVPDMRSGIGWYIDYYNHTRAHSSIDNLTPEKYYLRAMASAA
jgi:transposase IS3/IS911 family protein